MAHLPYAITATFTAGSPTVTATLAAFTAAVTPGDFVEGPDGKNYFVLSIESPTSLTLTKNYAGTTTTAAVEFARHSERWGSIAGVSVRLANIEEAVTRSTMQSNTSVLIGTGLKTFTVPAGLSHLRGQPMTATSAANTGNYMQGVIDSYVGSTLVLNVKSVGGSGTFTDWNISPSGDAGPKGDDGFDGDEGWSPVLAIVTDSARRVHQVIDWTGGTGTKPTTGQYVGSSGLVATAALAVDIRGAAGANGLDGIGGVNPNLIINGDFQVNQRAFAGGALAAAAFGHDRWKADTGGANYSVSGYTVTLSSGTIVQGINPAFWGYANLASTAVQLSFDSPSADLALTLGSASGVITAGSGRRTVTLVTGAGDTGNLSLKITKATAGTVTFGRVKAEVGAVATPWLARQKTLELQACRYHHLDIGGVALYQFTTDGGYVQSSTLAYAFLSIPDMYANPSLFVSSPAHFGINGGSGGLRACTAISIGVTSPGLIGLSCTVAGGLVVGQTAFLQANASTAGRIRLTSEI